MRFLILISILLGLLSIAEAQNIGLQTSTPDRDVDIIGTTRITKTSSGNLPQLDLQEDGGISAYTRLRLGNTQNSNYWLLASRPQDSLAAGRFNIFNSVIGNAFVLTDLGRMGLNVGGPSAMIHVNSTNGSDLLRLQRNGSTTFRIFDNGSMSFGTNNENISANDSYFHHNIGIGVTQPAERLDVNGRIKSTGLVIPTNASNGKVLTSNTSGVATWQSVPQDHLGNHEAEQPLDMQGNIIYNLEEPSDKQHAATKGYVDSHKDADASPTNEKINLLQVAGTNLQIREGSSSLQTVSLTNFYGLGDHTAYTLLNLNSNRAINVSDPINPQDAATKAYVDDNLGSSGGSGIADSDDDTSVAINNSDEILFEANGDIVGTLSQTNLDLSFGDHKSICIGEDAGASLSSTFALFNIAIGKEALNSSTTSFGNVAIGQSALKSNTSSGGNTAVGTAALQNSTTQFNTAVGNVALLSQTTGDRNTAIGYAAMSTPTTKSDCVAIGVDALSNVGSDEIVAIGSNAMNQAHGFGTVAIGFEACYRNNGSHSVVIGHQAMNNNNNGHGGDNVIIGAKAAQDNEEGDSNVAIGNQALQTNQFGNDNTGIGFQTMMNSAGTGHTSLGYKAGLGLTGGLYCTEVGHLTTQSVAAGAQINSAAFGNAALHNGSNQIRLGNSAVTSIGGYANWSSISDRRFKKNVKTDVPGLDFINALRPVTYNLDLHAIDDWHDTNHNWRDSTLINIGYEKEKVTYTGFLAQEVHSTANQLGYDFSGVDAPSSDQQFYALRYAEFVVPLTKAVQELSSELKIEKSKNDKLKEQLANYEQRFVILEAAIKKLENK